MPPKYFLKTFATDWVVASGEPGAKGVRSRPCSGPSGSVQGTVIAELVLSTQLASRGWAMVGATAKAMPSAAMFLASTSPKT